MPRSIRSLDFNPDGSISNNDIRVDSSGNLAVVDGLDEIKDRVTSSVLLRQGEDIWDENFGINYALLSNLSPIYRALIPSAILAHIIVLFGVTSARVRSEEINSPAREFSLDIDLDTIEGTTTIQT